MALAFSLEGRLGLNIAQFKTKLNESARNLTKTKGKMKKDTKTMRRNFNKVSKSVSNLGDKFNIMSALSVAGFALMTKSSLQAATMIDGLARTTKSTVDEIQTLTVGFKQLGLEADDVGDVLNTLADRGKDALEGMQSFVDDFRLIGIEVDDLKGKRPAELFETFANAVAKTEDPVARQAAIVRILGDDLGRKLAPALLLGADGFAKFADSARKAGVILDAGTIKAAVRANSSLKKLKATMSLGVTKAFATLGPVIEIVSEKLVSFLNLGKGVEISLVPAMKKVAAVFGFVADSVFNLRVAFKAGTVAFEGLKLAMIGGLKVIGDNINWFGTLITQSLLLPLKGLLKIGSFMKIVGKDMQAALDFISNLKVNLPTIDDKTFNEAVKSVKDSIKSMNDLAAEGPPSAGINKFFSDLEILNVKLRQTANIAEELEILFGDEDLFGFSSGLENLKVKTDAFGASIRSTLGSELQGILSGNFDSIGDSFKSLLIRMVADALAADLGNALGLGGATQGGSTGGNFLKGAAAVLGFAEGGRPPMNKVSLVGEKGPELFIPDQAGTILPNGVGTGGGQTINNNFVITTKDPETFRSARGRITSQLNSAMRS